MKQVTYRIRAKDFGVVESVDDKVFVSSKKSFPYALNVALLFKDHGNLSLIVDEKNPEFLKGMFVDGQVRGARIVYLPNGASLDKAYSLFASHLTVHDQSSSAHWDVLFRYPSGKFAYLYTLEKKRKALKKKYNHVRDFSRILPRLKKKLLNDVDKNPLVLPMLVLLETKMRVGNEIYYRRNHHKGLTTLKKHDISVKGDVVLFSFVGKDGVPQEIRTTFPGIVVKELKKVLGNKKPRDFVFVNAQGHPLRDTAFQSTFRRYVGQSFYPHIVRSHYATRTVEDFLSSNKSPSKKEVNVLYDSIAETLGHKKFSKKDHQWKVSHQVTLHHYIRPDLVLKLDKMVK